MNGETTTRGAVSFSLQLSTLEDIRSFCAVLAKTDMVPKAYKDKPDDILVAILHGQEVGLPHLQALQSIAVVNGIPSIYGDAALAMVRASGKLEEFDEYIEVDGIRQDGSFPIMKYADEDKEIVAVCISKRQGMTRERVTTFSVKDAQRAKLWEKKGHNGYETPWCTVPQRMLMWRARGWNLRDNFGDVLKGLAIYEEAMDLDASQGRDGSYRVVNPETDKLKGLLEDGREKLRRSQEPAKDPEPKKDAEKEHPKDTTAASEERKQEEKSETMPDTRNQPEVFTLAQIKAVLQNPESVKEIAEVMNGSMKLDLTPAERKEITDLKDEAMGKLIKKKK